MAKRGDVAVSVLLAGLTIAAIGLSLVVVLAGTSEPALAAAVVLVACTQLTLLLRIRARERATLPDDEQAPDEPLTADRENSGEASDSPSQRREPAGPGFGPARAPGAATDDGGGFRTGIAFIDDGRLDLYLEPIVEVSKRRTVYYRASLALTRPDGSRLSAYALRLKAERSGVAPALDFAIFRRVCPVVRHLKARDRRPGVFCPLTPQSFAERAFLDELVEFLKLNQDAAAGMVVEVAEPDLAALTPAGMEGLAHLAELGATFSLSETLVDGADLLSLSKLGFQFIDIDIAAVANAHGRDAVREGGAVHRLARRAADAGLTVIAANLVRSEELDDVTAFARLARGSLFSPPRAVRHDVVEPSAEATAA